MVALLLSLVAGSAVAAPARASAGSSHLTRAQPVTAVDSPVELDAPAVPQSVGRTSSFTVGGALSPPQPAGDLTVSLACYRREGGLWVQRLTVTATVGDQAGSSAYAASLSLPQPGSWRLRAVYAAGTPTETSSPWSRTVAVGGGPDAPVWNRDGVTTLPERMAGRSNARQLIVVTGRTLGSRTGTLRLFDYRSGDWVQSFAAAARFGFHGLINGLLRRAGSLTTPTGIWRLPSFVFGTHAGPPSGTRMAYRRITPHSWWSAEPGATYNTWVETAKAIAGEHLADYRADYEFAFSSGYNAAPNPSVYGRGSAIFVHVFPRTYTAGCIAVSRANMIRLVRALDPALRPACAVGTTGGGRTSIYAY